MVLLGVATSPPPVPDPSPSSFPKLPPPVPELVACAPRANEVALVSIVERDPIVALLLGASDSLSEKKLSCGAEFSPSPSPSPSPSLNK